MVQNPALLTTLLLLTASLALTPTAFACGAPGTPVTLHCGADGTPSRATAAAPGVGVIVFADDDANLGPYVNHRTGLVVAGPVGAGVVRDCADVGNDGTCEDESYFVASSALPVGLFVRASDSGTQVCPYAPVVGRCVGAPALP